MQKLIKVSAYNTYDHKTLVESFINPDHVVSLTVITDTKETWYMVYLTNSSYRITPNSYVKLVRELYGEDYDLQTPGLY